MNEETRNRANSLNEEISDLKRRLEKCAEIRNRFGKAKTWVTNYHEVVIPEEIEESILVQVEFFHKAKLQKLEKEFADL
jgi:hypothetical protein